MNPSELFTGQLSPTKPAIPDSQQPRLPLKEIGLEAEGHSRKHRGGENRAARQSDPPGWWYYGNSLTTWGQYWEIEPVPGSRHDYKKNQDYFADPHWAAGIAGFLGDPPGRMQDEVVATGAGDHSAVGIPLLVPLTPMIILAVGIPVLVPLALVTIPAVSIAVGVLPLTVLAFQP